MLDESTCFSGVSAATSPTNHQWWRAICQPWATVKRSRCSSRRSLGLWPRAAARAFIASHASDRCVKFAGCAWYSVRCTNGLTLHGDHFDERRSCRPSASATIKRQVSWSFTGPGNMACDRRARRARVVRFKASCGKGRAQNCSQLAQWSGGSPGSGSRRLPERITLDSCRTGMRCWGLRTNCVSRRQVWHVAWGAAHSWHSHGPNCKWPENFCGSRNFGAKSICRRIFASHECNSCPASLCFVLFRHCNVWKRRANQLCCR